MLTKESREKARQVILSEIVSTLEFIAYLKHEAKGSVERLIRREELKKRMLMLQLEIVED